MSDPFHPPPEDLDSWKSRDSATFSQKKFFSFWKIYFLYVLVVTARVLYDWHTERGLYGWIAGLFLKWFGSFEYAYVLIIEMALLCLPAILVFSYLRPYRRQPLEKTRPLPDRLTEENFYSDRGEPLGFDRFRFVQPTRRAKPFSWKQILIVVGIYNLAAGLFYVYLHWELKSDLQREVVSLDLSTTDRLPENAKFVKLSAQYRANSAFTLQFKEKGPYGKIKSQVFWAPLVSPVATVEEPIAFVMRIKSFGDSNQVFFNPEAESDKKYHPHFFNVGTTFEGTFPGILKHKQLPSYVEKEWMERGFKIADRVSVLEFESLVNARDFKQVWEETQSQFIFQLSIALLTGHFFLWGILFLIRSKVNAQIRKTT